MATYDAPHERITAQFQNSSKGLRANTLYASLSLAWL